MKITSIHIRGLSFILTFFIISCSESPKAPTTAEAKLKKLQQQILGDGCNYHKSYSDKVCEYSYSDDFYVRSAKLMCPIYAARCLPELGEIASKAIPEILSTIKTGSDVYNTGDGSIGFRSMMIKSLIPFLKDPSVLPALIEVLNSKSSDYSKKTALNVIRNYKNEGIISEKSILNLIKDSSPELRTEAVITLLRIHSSEAETATKDILLEHKSLPSKTSQILGELLKYPTIAKTLSDEIINILKNVMDDSYWANKIKNTRTVREANDVFYQRQWLARRILRFYKIFNWDRKALKKDLPLDKRSQPKGVEWKNILDIHIKTFFDKKSKVSLEQKCQALALLASSNDNETLIQFENALVNPLEDIVVTYSAIDSYYSNKSRAEQHKEKFVKLAEDIADTKLWEKRLKEASSKTEKQKIFKARILFGHHSPLSGLLWTLN